MAALVERADLQQLFDALNRRGFRIIGPTLRDRAIVYDDIAAVADLPVGWTDEQDGGTYRLKQRADRAVFGYAVGPTSWKRFLFPPLLRLLETRRRADGTISSTEPPDDPPPYAFIGARPCDLAAIAVQDAVFLRGAYADPAYRRRRERVFIVAVQCTHAGGTCFCVSMGTGPRAQEGFDLALTEALQDGRHFFVVETGTEQGAMVLADVPHREASPEEMAAARQAVDRTAAQMGRALETIGIKDLLYRSYDHRRWEDVAARCLACANCTMVCPTCFCAAVEDTTDLTGDHAERWRRWDSCFTAAFSYIHGGSIRTSTKARYRHWLVHKLGSWIDQFGTSGCVGCGRCITWCPVGIDLTEEVRALRGARPPGEGAAQEATHGDA